MLNISHRISLILLPLSIICTGGEARADNDSFYIWQRAWNTGRITEAAKNVNSYRFYFLAGEFTASKSERITPSAEFYSLKKTLVPVFRIHTSFFYGWIKQKEIFTKRLLCEFRRLCKEHRKNFHELQIDLDSPVSKLNYYGEFLAAVKKELPAGTILSFTALPCHLRSKNFKETAKFADYYVLQVHGLEVPKQLSEKVEILNIKTANLAIERAEKLGFPYFLALPTYAYQLNFNKETKKFLFLNAEKCPPKNSELITEIIAPDFKNLASLVARERNGNWHNCKGIIWFRMPVPGDRYNLDYKTIKILQEGKIPKKEITAHWQKKQNGTDILVIENRGVLDNGKIHISIEWQKNKGVYDLFRKFDRDKNDNLQDLPNSIISSIPPPGRVTPVGWFRTDNKTTPSIKIEIETKHTYKGEIN